MGEIRNDLNGQRAVHPVSKKFYLVDRGVKRWINDPFVLERILKNWDYNASIDVELIADGPVISEGTIVKGDKTPQQYFIDMKKKRHILDPRVLLQYNFRNFKEVPQEVVDAIPDGDSIAINNGEGFI